MQNTDFKLVKNRLNPEERIYPYIVFENDYYTARLYYMKDYIKARDDRNIKISETAAVIKTKNPVMNDFNIRLMTDKFISSVSDVILDSEKVYDNFKRHLDIAEISCRNLDKIFHEYFLKYAP